MVKVVDVDLKEIVKPLEKICNIQKSTLRNQVYDFKIEIREKAIKATALAFITFMTVDKSNNQNCVLGYSFFPLFLENTEGGLPMTLNNEAKKTPHLGLYQMPIFAEHVSEEKPFTYEKFIFKERVPTASVLLRVLKAPKNEQGNVINMRDFSPHDQDKARIAPPEYLDGRYSTKYIAVTAEQIKVMELRRRRPNPELEPIVGELLKNNKLSPDLVYQNPLALEENLHKLLATNLKKPQFLDLTYHSQYESTLGVRVNTVAVHDNKVKGYFAVMASILPPGSYYDENRDGPPSDIFTFVQPDFKCNHLSYRFEEGEACVKGFKPTSNGLTLLFDIKVYHPDKDQFTDYGFATCPILKDLDTDANEDTTEWYVQSGVFSL